MEVIHQQQGKGAGIDVLVYLMEAVLSYETLVNYETTWLHILKGSSVTHAVTCSSARCQSRTDNFVSGQALLIYRTGKFPNRSGLLSL
jgi:hypothetical protein